MIGIGSDLLIYNLITKKIKSKSLDDDKRNLITYLYVDSLERIWVGRRSGVWFYENIELENKEVLLEGKTISCIHQDSNHNYWFSTNEGGYQLSNPAVKSYSIDDLAVTTIEKHQNKLYLGLNNGKIGWLEKGVVKQVDEEIIKGPVIDLQSEEDTLWIGGGTGFYAFYHKKHTPFYMIGGNVRSIEKLKDGLLVGGSSFVYSKEKIRRENPKFHKQIIRVNDIVEDKNGMVWVSSNNGLFHFRNDSIFEIDTFSILKKSVNALFSFDKGVLFSQRGKIYYFDRKSKPIVWFDLGNNYSVRKIVSISENSFGILTANHGLVIVQLNDDKKQVHYLSNKNGLISNHINDMIVEGNVIWLATQDGLVSVDLEKQNWYDYQMPLYFQSVKVKNDFLPLKRSYEWPYGTDFIEITYAALDYNNARDIVYEYQIPELDEDWVRTKNRNINLYGLAPGVYTINVKIAGEDQASESMMVMIQAPFWQTWWFISILLISTIFAIYTFFRIRFNRLKEKTTLERKIIAKDKERLQLREQAFEMEQKALRAQMNPHFIFNALSAVQSYMVKNNVSKAIDFLAKFGKLIRFVLNSSRNDFVYLEDEVNMLSFYLEIEKGRLNDSFDFTINIDEELLHDDIMVPSMILQPYIENAILHGLKHLKDRKGQLSLSFDITDDERWMICELQDNGIGRAASKIINEKNRGKHQSVGILATKERLQLLNQKMGKDIEIKMEDLQEPTTGTKISIHLPVAD